MNSPVHYFAYGSNLHPARLQDRLGECELVGAGLLAGYRLAFHKRGGDGSGKCDAVATGSTDDTVFGAMYRLHADQLARLDTFEGQGYRRAQVDVVVRGATDSVPVFAYLARTNFITAGLRPFGWYRELVLAGARYRGFPAAYIAAIAQVPVMHDPDARRNRLHRAIIAER